MSSAKSIVINSDAFYELLHQVVERIAEVHGLDKANRWISAEDCMTMLNIKSRTTLWELKAEGKIAYSQVSKKVTLYDRISVLEFINKQRKKAF